LLFQLWELFLLCPVTFVYLPQVPHLWGFYPISASEHWIGMVHQYIQRQYFAAGIWTVCKLDMCREWNLQVLPIPGAVNTCFLLLSGYCILFAIGRPVAVKKLDSFTRHMFKLYLELNPGHFLIRFFQFTICDSH
jgi:hypothetical protein